MSPHLIIILVLSCCSLIFVLISALHRQEKKILAELEIERAIKSKDQSLSPQQVEELIQLVNRFRFFQGENLNHFTSALRRQDLLTVKCMIQQKFSAQQKPNSEQLAEQVFEKLLTSVMPSAKVPPKTQLEPLQSAKYKTKMEF